MKILHVTDLHFAKPHFRWILENQNKFDVICLSGDFLDTHINCPYSLQQQIKWITAWVKTINVRLLLCSGNHDEYHEAELLSMEELFNLDDNPACDDIDYHPSSSTSWIKELAGGNITVDGGVAEVAGLQFGCIAYGEDDFAKYADCDVLLYHVPPYGNPTAIQAGRDYGCKSITRSLKNGVIQPRWLLSGHVHAPVKNTSTLQTTKISNPGAKSSGAEPMKNVIKIDIEGKNGRD